MQPLYLVWVVCGGGVGWRVVVVVDGGSGGQGFPYRFWHGGGPVPPIGGGT